MKFSECDGRARVQRPPISGEMTQTTSTTQRRTEQL